MLNLYCTELVYMIYYPPLCFVLSPVLIRFESLFIPLYLNFSPQKIRSSKFLKFNSLSENLTFIFLAQKFEGSTLRKKNHPEYKFPPTFFQKFWINKVLNIPDYT